MQRLKYAQGKSGAWVTQVVDSVIDGFAGKYSSLAVRPSGQPAIAYHCKYYGVAYDYTEARYAWYDGEQWQVETVAQAQDADTGEYTSLAFLPSGQAAVSYYDRTHGQLKYALRFTPGDLNCDGQIDAFDIEAFVLALIDPAGYLAKYPDCSYLLADINEDTKVDAFDIDPFVKLLTGS
jgi:hypothetical protein